MKLKVITLMLLVSSVAFADTYKWTDDNGKTHYSDKPMHEDAVKVSSPTSKASKPDADATADSTQESSTAKGNTSTKEKPAHHCAKSVLVDYESQKDGDPKAKYKCLES